VLALEQPEPRGTDALEVLDGDQRRVARPAPALHVPPHRRLAARRDAVDAPVVRVPEHVPHEGNILRAAWPDHDKSSVSWMRLPSGSNTSSRRMAPCSSSTAPPHPPPPPGARSREPLALGLHVLDVDRRDLAFRLPARVFGLADRDLGLPAVERDPALVLVDERLPEAHPIPEKTH